VETVYIFKRYEKKYLLTGEQRDTFLSLIGDRLRPDGFGESVLHTTYFDTPDWLLIRNSIEARGYKEKLRFRSYGEPTPDGRVFLEIKKKCRGVVYKRRISTTHRELEGYLSGGTLPDSQIMREIEYTMERYSRPSPKMEIRCHRTAFFDRSDPAVRITFDSDLCYRPVGERDFSPVLDKNTVVMEIKTGGAMPLWLSRTLCELSLFPQSFSKYGTAYRLLIGKEDLK